MYNTGSQSVFTSQRHLFLRPFLVNRACVGSLLFLLLKCACHGQVSINLPCFLIPARVSSTDLQLTRGPLLVHWGHGSRQWGKLSSRLTSDIHKSVFPLKGGLVPGHDTLQTHVVTFTLSPKWRGLAFLGIMLRLSSSLRQSEISIVGTVLWPSVACYAAILLSPEIDVYFQIL